MTCTNALRRYTALKTSAIGFAIVLISLGAQAVAATLPATASESPPCAANGTLNCPGTDGDGYVYIYDPVTQTVVAIPRPSRDPGEPDATFAYATSAACPQAQPRDGDNCTEAAQFCAANGSSGVHEDIWRMQTSPVTSSWTVIGQICTGDLPNPVPVGQVIAAIGEYERDHMPIPVPDVQPASIAIVNLPVLVSVPQPGPQTMQVQQPVPGLLVATPTYTWKFDDGTTVTGAGVPYDGTDPRVDPGHYVSHAYTAAEAQASVTLTVTWNATFTAAGQVFTIPPLVMPPITATFSVHEAHSVLVSGNETTP